MPNAKMPHAHLSANRCGYRLAYRSQMETAHDRTFRRANNLRERLGWVAGIVHPPGSKPKGMELRQERQKLRSFVDVVCQDIQMIFWSGYR